ncbi:uncharacterized protein LOC116189539 [Punica granatum]|nr:uncharacterized protein LOC116189539 [Punica granatum]PKI33896.1 hypothetical protein CRG98_045726 [Punica granatum]
MGKIFVEVCLISARGLGRSSSLFWKTQWFAVGWIDPDDKYCTKIDAPANGNPVWRTKFSALVDDSRNAESKDVALRVEVYSRDPIFLREKLQGTATVVLREFLTKRRTSEETGSYQLRKRNSNKPRGFVDISIRVSEGGEDPNSFSAGYNGGLMLVDNENSITLAPPNDALTSSTSYEPYPTGPTPLPLAAASHLQRPNLHQSKPEVELSYTHPTPIPPNFSNPSVGGPAYPRAIGPSYLPPRPAPPMPLPPPPAGTYNYRPAYLPAEFTNGTYFNMPSSAAGRGGRGPMGYGAALGAGALGAGAVLLGDGLVSGYDMPLGFQDPSLIVSLDPPF